VTLDKDTILTAVRIMAKVTSKLQVTVPKAIAERYGIRPGDDIEWMAAGEAIRVVPARKRAAGRGGSNDRAARVRLFDEATARQRERESAQPAPRARAKDRGWTRAELYERGRSR
jgi:AbrB family looped-hinge helix DNA binding protein